MANQKPPVSRIKLLAQQFAAAALDLIFPPVCVNCTRVGSFLCPRCISALPPAPVRQVVCLDAVRAAVNYEGAASAAIKALKYEGQTRLAVPLGDLMVQAIAPEGWPVEMVTAVPLHSARLRERGYNQAALLGTYIAQQQGWMFCTAALERQRETQSQVHLNAIERQKNVADAFKADSRLVAGKTVLLVDDVLTTGATMSACAEALRRAGAAQVYGVTAAAAIFSDQS